MVFGGLSSMVRYFYPKGHLIVGRVLLWNEHRWRMSISTIERLVLWPMLGFLAVAVWATLDLWLAKLLELDLNKSIQRVAQKSLILLVAMLLWLLLLCLL